MEWVQIGLATVTAVGIWAGVWIACRSLKLHREAHKLHREALEPHLQIIEIRHGNMSEVPGSGSDAAIVVTSVNSSQRVITLQDYLIDLDGDVVTYPSRTHTVKDKNGENRLPRKLILGDHCVFAYKVPDILRLANDNLARVRIGYQITPGDASWSSWIDIL